MLAEPPHNGEYLVAAYVVATVILVGYWLRLWRMARKSVSTLFGLSVRPSPPRRRPGQ
jgi:hypothetical protein